MESSAACAPRRPLPLSPRAAQTLLPKTAAVDCFSKRRLVILLSDFVYWQIRVGIWLMGLILGYRPFVAKKNSLALSCHTNGMGHVIQMLRIIDVLNAAQIPVGLIVLASKGKIPAHFLASLREKAGPDAEIVDLDHEVHYDDNNGAKINNLRVVLEAGWKIFGPEGWRTVKQCIGLLMKHRPEVCLSLWDPHLPIMIDAFSCPTHNLQVATQAIMYEAGRGQDLVLDMLYLLNVGLKGELLPLVRPSTPSHLHTLTPPHPHTSTLTAPPSHTCRPSDSPLPPSTLLTPSPRLRPPGLLPPARGHADRLRGASSPPRRALHRRLLMHAASPHPHCPSDQAQDPPLRQER